jgi:hypothetical protein
MLEVLNTLNGSTSIYIEGTKEKNYLIKKYGQGCLKSEYFKNGKAIGWNASVPTDDISGIKKDFKEL